MKRIRKEALKMILVSFSGAMILFIIHKFFAPKIWELPKGIIKAILAILWLGGASIFIVAIITFIVSFIKFLTGKPFESEVINKVQCSRCGKSLVELNMSRGALTFGGRVPVLYNGVICSRCGKIECTDCRRGIPIDAPCRWCGSEVYPAYDIYLKR
jgi:ribosomal protein L37E